MHLRTTIAVLATLPLCPLLLAAPESTGPYDLSAADALLEAALSDLEGDVAVIVRQDGRDVYRFQAGSIGEDTLVGMASFTKTISAGVILALVDEGLIDLDERLGDALPLFERQGLGDPTVLDAWGMRHGIETPLPYEWLPKYTLAESVTRIALTGSSIFDPGTMLGYDGDGMQTTGLVAELRAGGRWDAIARTRILDPCGMAETDYGQFAPNPAIAGGLRSSAAEAIEYVGMIQAGGAVAGRRVLSFESIERMFTNATRDLPVAHSPFPPTHPEYPYGVDPDYGFGAWVLAEHPVTRHVEELVGAGAWGSYLWIDRRRGLSAVFVVDVPAGSMASTDPALGLFSILRETTEAQQVRALHVEPVENGAELRWTAPPEAVAVRIRASNAPVRDLVDLRAATLLLETDASEAIVAAAPFYAVTAVLPGGDDGRGFENVALIPGGNARPRVAPCLADLDEDATVGTPDLLALLAAWGTDGPADLDGDGSVGAIDLVLLLARWGDCGG